MADLPIIFSGPMVRALLDGHKTMTRRLPRKGVEVPAEPSLDAIFPGNAVTHDRPYLDSYCGDTKTVANPRGMGRNWCWWTRDNRCGVQFKVGYVPGDRLWIRESVTRFDKDSCDQHIWYQAGRNDDYLDLVQDPNGKWTLPEGPAGGAPYSVPAIHMPRWASRATLLVTGVKVERLQTISREDAIAEGATCRPRTHGYGGQQDGWCMDWSPVGNPTKYNGHLQETDISHGDPRMAFGCYINQLHGGDNWNLKPSNLWDENPFVIALSFKVEKQNIDRMALVAA